MTVQRTLLAMILAGYILVAAAFAIRTPDWQTPDEPAHYNYIAQIAEDGKLPRIELGDWDQTYLSALTGSRFEPALLDDLDSVQYEDHQPPLFYLLASPVYLLSDGSMTALRLFSAAWGIVIVICTYVIGLLMFPQRPSIGLGAAAFVAFLPQHVHILASVNNDALAWAIVAVSLWMALAIVKRAAPVKPWQMGLLVGLGFITKATTYFLAGLMPLALVLRWWIDRHNDDGQELQKLERGQNVGLWQGQENPYKTAARPSGTALWRDLVAFALPAVALGLLWWLRNISVYGFPDVLGLREHDAVVIGQPRTAELIERIGWGGYLQEIGSVTLNSFVGRFGWMGVPMTGWPYALILMLMGAGLAGLLLNVWWRHSLAAEQMQRSRQQEAAWSLLLATIALSILAYLYYNIEFQQHQGRYMYPLLIPLGLLLALGVDAWQRLLLHPLGESHWRQRSVWLTTMVFMALGPLCIWLLWRVIVPNLAL